MFYRVKHHEAQPSGFRPGKTRLTSFFVLFFFSNSLKSTPGKKSASIDNYAFVNVGN